MSSLKPLLLVLASLSLWPCPARAADPSTVSATASAMSATAAALSPSAASLTKTPLSSLSRGFDEKQPISLQGHVVHFNQTDETMLAEGDVVLQSEDTEVHADRLWYDMKQGLMRAEGRVVVADATGNTLWAEHLAMNQVSKTGQAEDIVYSKMPWTAACGGADILPGDVVVLHGCECTSCRQANPMWRLSAKTLKIKAGDTLWAWGVWLYTGRVPVFYLPYFSRSLKDPRPPLEIRPGYNSTVGAYVRLGYNYYFDDGNFGTLRYDDMQKVGNGYGLGEHYKYPGAEGSVAGYFAEDKYDSTQREFSANLSHKESLGQGLSLLANVDILSNPSFNQTYDINQVDNYQQRSYLALQSSQKTYTWSLQAGYTENLQTIPPGPGQTQPLTQTVLTQEQLPSFTYNHYPTALWDGAPLYWSVAAIASRSLQTPQILEFITSTSSAVLTGPGGVTLPAGSTVSVYNNASDYFVNGITLTPTITDTLRLMRGLALNSNVSLNAGWQMTQAPDGAWGAGSLLAGYATFFDLQARPKAGLTLDLGHRYLRQLDPVVGALWSGEGTNQLEAKVQAQLGEPLSVLVSDYYDLRPFVTDNELKRLGLIRLQSTWSRDNDHSANLTAAYHVPTGAFKTVDASFNANDHKKVWQLNLGADWVNNAIVPTAPVLDPNAPIELNYQNPRFTPDQLLASARTTLALGPDWKVSYYEQLDLVNRRANEQAYTVDRDFKCIDLQVYARQNLSLGWQYGFALSLDSVPGVKINSNDLTNGLFNPVQYGY